MTEPEQLGEAWDRAFASGVPAVLDVHCDPEVPPIPPHADLRPGQVGDRGGAQGDPDAFHLMAQGVKTKAQEFLRGRRSSG